MEHNLFLYKELLQSRPELFDNNEAGYVIQTSFDLLEQYEREHEKSLGVVYRSPFNMLVIDLVQDKNGKIFPYERIIPTKNGRPVVMILVLEDGNFILLEQYRHAPRQKQYAFPRGFDEDAISSRDNAAKELSEELGAAVLSLEHIGSVISDSGLTSSEADVYIACVEVPQTVEYEEGIVNIHKRSHAQIVEMVKNGEVNDGLTLSALALYWGRNKL